jgi:hypothetical protein
LNAQDARYGGFQRSDVWLGPDPDDEDLSEWGLSLTVFSKSCPHSLDRLHHLTPFGRRGPVGLVLETSLRCSAPLDTEDDETSFIPSLPHATTALLAPLSSAALAAHLQQLRVSDVLLLSPPAPVPSSPHVRFFRWLNRYLCGYRL